VAALPLGATLGAEALPDGAVLGVPALEAAEGLLPDPLLQAAATRTMPRTVARPRDHPDRVKTRSNPRAVISLFRPE